MAYLSVYVKDPQLVERLNADITSRRLAGDFITRNALIGQLISEYLGEGSKEGSTLSAPKIRAKRRFFLTISNEFAWLATNLAKIVRIKRESGVNSSIQKELVLLAVHGFLSDPSYGQALRSFLDDSH